MSATAVRTPLASLNRPPMSAENEFLDLVGQKLNSGLRACLLTHLLAVQGYYPDRWVPIRLVAFGSEYNVNHSSIRRALQVLVEAGVIERREVQIQHAAITGHAHPSRTCEYRLLPQGACP